LASLYFQPRRALRPSSSLAMFSSGLVLATPAKRSFPSPETGAKASRPGSTDRVKVIDGPYSGKVGRIVRDHRACNPVITVKLDDGMCADDFREEQVMRIDDTGADLLGKEVKFFNEEECVWRQAQVQACVGEYLKVGDRTGLVKHDKVKKRFLKAVRKTYTYNWGNQYGRGTKFASCKSFVEDWA